MEEYIRLEEEKARKRGKMFNWQTATYEKILVDVDLHDLSSVEAEFPSIVINDDFAPQDALQYKSQVSTLINDEIDFRISFDESDDEDYTIIYIALPPREQRHKFLRYEGLEYTDYDITDFEARLARIHMREVHRVPVFDFGGLPDLMAEGLTARMTMEHRDESGISVELDDTWAWVAMGPERQPDAAAGALAEAEDVLIVDEVGQADPAPAQAPQQPPPPAPVRTIPYRLGRLKEDVQELHQDVGSLRGLVERSMTDQGRFSTWIMTCMTQLMDASGLTYQALDGYFRGSSSTAFQRRTRQRTGEANTSTTQHDQQQPDP
ncbi:hypothetical protein Tco_0200886 [Tanacetum coccineum]